MNAKYIKILAAIIAVAAVFITGYHIATLRYGRDIAEIEALKRDAVERTADAERVRQQFSRLHSSRSATLEQCNRRAIELTISYSFYQS